MKFNHLDNHSEINFSFKERLMILFKGKVKFNHLNSYKFYSSFMHMISLAIEKYGDAKKHGLQKLDSEIKIQK
jgi:hypothetical protein